MELLAWRGKEIRKWQMKYVIWYVLTVGCLDVLNYLIPSEKTRVI